MMTPNRFPIFVGAFLGASLLFFSSCEKNPLGPIDTRDAAPFVTGASLSPDSLNIDQLTPSGGSYTISSSLTANVLDPDGPGDVREVDYTLYRTGTAIVLATGPLSRVTGLPDTAYLTFSAIVSFQVTRLDMGRYRIQVGAFDQSGAQSNLRELTLTVAKKASAPTLSSSGYRRAGVSGDSVLFLLTVAAFDSNGIADVASVTVRAQGSTDTSTQTLLDDGLKAHGDAVAGDGVFSGYVWVVPTTNLSSVTFDFTALGQSGLRSNVLQRQYANHPPQILSLTAPDSIQRPASGTDTVAFFMAVADSDGLSDIDSVYFENLSSQTPVPILMYDDGDYADHRDAVAGDGTYSRGVTIDPSTTTGVKEFHFYVVDRAGARAERVHPITVY